MTTTWETLRKIVNIKLVSVIITNTNETYWIDIRDFFSVQELVRPSTIEL